MLRTGLPFRLLVCCVVFALCWTTAGHPQIANDQRTIDHVILSSSELTRDSVLFRNRTGVAPGWGGRHPGRGSQNALVSIGPTTYLEIIAPFFSVESSPEESKRAERTATEMAQLAPLTPIGWAIRTSDLDSTIRQLEVVGFQMSVPAAGSRQRPTGELLRWRTAGLRDTTIAAAPSSSSGTRASSIPQKRRPRAAGSRP